MDTVILVYYIYVAGLVLRHLKHFINSLYLQKLFYSLKKYIYLWGRIKQLITSTQQHHTTVQVSNLRRLLQPTEIAGGIDSRQNLISKNELCPGLWD